MKQNRTSPWEAIRHLLAGSPSRPTRDWWVEAQQAGQSWWHRIHGYVYARWPYGYIGAAIGEKPQLARKRLLFAPFLAKALFPQSWGESYHGKVVDTEHATRLIQVHEMVDQIVPEQVIPFDTARHLVLVQDQPIVALDCPCRLSRENPCLPLDVCLVIGDPFASFILEHHPQRSRAITQQEAVDILQAEARRGHVHHAFFKEAMIERFYAICNCCSCCCGAMSAHQHNVPMLISSGYVAHIDESSCQACGACASICPFNAIKMDGKAQVDIEICMGCGVCATHCPAEAIQLSVDQSKPAPLYVPAQVAS